MRRHTKAQTKLQASVKPEMTNVPVQHSQHVSTENPKRYNGKEFTAQLSLIHLKATQFTSNTSDKVRSAYNTLHTTLCVLQKSYAEHKINTKIFKKNASKVLEDALKIDPDGKDFLGNMSQKISSLPENSYAHTFFKVEDNQDAKESKVDDLNFSI